MKNILFAILLIITSNCFAQINTFFVEPIQTDLNYSADEESHLVVRNMAINNDKLFLFIGGSFSSPSSYQGISNFAGELGYDVINLAYKNNVPAAFFSNNSDELAFTNYRQHLCYGTPLTFMQVDSLNSIYTRTVKLLNYLDATYPSENWGQYLENSSTLNWTRIAVGGHSQGSGHACYFAKQETPERVLMFSGPNDYSEYFSSPAIWLSEAGNTSLDRHFSYLHLYDNVVDFSEQLDNIEALGLYPFYDTTLVETIANPYNNSQCLYLQDTSGFISAHSKTIAVNSLNDAVWTYMLTTDIATNITEIEDNKTVLIYPNPTNSVVTFHFNQHDFKQNYVVRNINGQTLLSGQSDSMDAVKIDLSTMQSGIYFVTFDKETFKVIKN